jgi:hypothetical protein
MVVRHLCRSIFALVGAVDLSGTVCFKFFSAAGANLVIDFHGLCFHFLLMVPALVTLVLPQGFFLAGTFHRASGAGRTGTPLPRPNEILADPGVAVCPGEEHTPVAESIANARAILIWDAIRLFLLLLLPMAL